MIKEQLYLQDKFKIKKICKKNFTSLFLLILKNTLKKIKNVIQYTKSKKKEKGMNKKWQIYQTNEEEVKKIADKYQINQLLTSIIVNRKIEEEKIDVFLHPTRQNFHDPFLMPDMKIAVERILKAIENKEKTIIFGDYDVDGITSITVLKSFLEDRGLHVDSYIPNRLEEGYGLNKPAIEEIAKKQYTLMITVDCGISGIEEIEYANSLGIETIVTDHHEVGEELPNALAVVDAKRKDNIYPCRDLAGVGVVFKLTQALRNKIRIRRKRIFKIFRYSMCWNNIRHSTIS